MMPRGGSRSLDEPEKRSPGIFYPDSAPRGRAPRPPAGRSGGGLALPAREDATALLSRRCLPVAPRRVPERAPGTACP